jgi:hypothetical protein
MMDVTTSSDLLHSTADVCSQLRRLKKARFVAMQQLAKRDGWDWSTRCTEPRLAPGAADVQRAGAVQCRCGLADDAGRDVFLWALAFTDPPAISGATTPARS